MTAKRYTETEQQQILSKINAETSKGSTLADAVEKFNVSLNTFYNWRKKHSGVQLIDTQKPRKTKTKTPQTSPVKKSKIMVFYGEGEELTDLIKGLL